MATVKTSYRSIPIPHGKAGIGEIQGALVQMLIYIGRNIGKAIDVQGKKKGCLGSIHISFEYTDEGLVFEAEYESSEL